MIRTPNRVKVMDWLSVPPDLHPTEHPQRKVEQSMVSNIQQLWDVVQDQGKRVPAAACEALVNPIPTG